jgi:hypothetical protein
MGDASLADRPTGTCARRDPFRYPQQRDPDKV